MKPFEHWSASQVSTYRLCNRKWYFGKIMGIAEPESQALVDGKRYASECEVYMKTGSTAGMSSVTRPVAALHGGPSTFPKPSHRNTLVEYPIGLDTRPEGEKTPGVHVTLLDVDGLPGVGFMDVLDIKEDRPVCWDFKSTKAKRWIKTTDELRSDVQMAGIYASAVSKLHQIRYGKPPEMVGVAHVAMPKPPEAPEAVVVGPTWLTPADIEDQWQGIKTSVREMKKVALIPSADRVTPSWSACSAFGGCPHRDRCQSLKQAQALSVPTQQGTNSMTLLEKLAAAQNTTPGTAGKTVALTTSTPAKATAADDLAAKIRAKLASPGQINPPDAANPAADKALAAVVAPKPVVASTPAPRPVTLEARRQPRNGTPRLKALGWTDEVIEAMSVDRKHEVLDGNIAPPVEAVESEPEVVIDLNSNEALEMGEALGWTELQMNDMDDAVFSAILKDGLRADTHTAVMGATGRIVDVAPIEVEVVEAKPAPRTRRPAATLAPTVEPPDIEAQVAEAEREQHAEGLEQAEREQVAAPVTNEPLPLMLFVDCRPTKGYAELIELAEYCAPFMQVVCERKKVEHYNLVPYNEGEKLVAALLLMNPPEGIVVVDSSAPLSKWALEVLLPLAKMVVRGVRS